MTIAEFEQYEKELDEIPGTNYFPSEDDYERYLAKTPGLYSDFIVWLMLKAKEMELSDEQKAVKKKLTKAVYHLFSLEE